MGPVKKITMKKVQLILKGKKYESFKISNASDAARFFKKIWPCDIEIRERFFVLYLNNRNETIGFFEASVGGPASCLVPVQQILQAALLLNAQAFITCHNHPSGTLKVSEPDKKMAKKLKEVAELHDMVLLDNLIITKDSYEAY